MSAENYKFALSAVLTYEGGRVDNPKDPGGRTAYGIIQRVYDGYRDAKGLPRRDVWAISETERNDIYRQQYWDAIKGDRLPVGIDAVVFDGSVNSGVSQSAKWLQRALGTVKVDGVIGEATLGAVAAHPDHDALIASICEQRVKFLKALRTWSTFGKGWSKRVEKVLQAGQAQATGSVEMPVITYVQGGAAKASESDLKKAPSQAVGAVIAAASLSVPQIVDNVDKIGKALPGLTDTVNQLKGELLVQVGIMPFLQPVIDNLTLIGSGLAVAGLVYTFYGKLRAAFINDAANVQSA